ncbi:protein BRANCHLESS TRICHOME-like [Tasmannia lanceolata]|uniref:protein BRANCHLESS TRICHOME-like n=1 Tax=Tasmannia lanceolata TaxID=3420 RepID=UPI00406476E9
MMMEGGGEEEELRNPTSPLPIWKLYNNPFYCSQHQNHHHHNPLSSRKFASSVRDLNFFHTSIHSNQSSTSLRRQSELDLARAQVEDLKAEVEFERKMRKKAEYINKRLAKEVEEEKKEREAMGSVCEELANEIAVAKAKIVLMKREMEEERKMLRIAELWMEERMEIKLAEERILMENKLPDSKRRELGPLERTTNSKAEEQKVEKRGENPHIKRGIKGFVEFQRVIRAVGLRERQSSSKVECQKAQIRILSRHKSSDGLAVG